MIKKLLFATMIGVGILTVPNWKAPYSDSEIFIMLLGWVLMLGPGFMTLIAIFNRGINISFRTDYEDKKK